MKRICIIGIGLIGGSIGMDIKRLHLADEVVGVVRRKDAVAESIQYGAVDRATMDIAEGIDSATLIILAVPISKMLFIAEKIKTKGIIIDVASVKGGLVNRLESILGRNYVGTHPIAGSEKKGVSGAKTGIFKGAACVITPTKNTNPDAVKAVSGFWEKLGADVFSLSADEHDKLAAVTSHLPHLAASSLINTVGEGQDEARCLGPGIKDTTRIAGSPPELWQDICKWNKNAILESIEKFEKEMYSIKNLISSENWDGLLNKLASAKKLRDKWKL